MSRRNTNIGDSLNIVKDRIRYYRELNNYSYQENMLPKFLLQSHER